MSAQQVQQNQNGQVKEDELKIEIEPVAFDGDMGMKLTTTMDLAEIINSIFSPIFADYEGCLIMPNQQGQLELSMFFKDKGNQRDKIKNVINAVTITNRNTSPMDRIRSMNTRNKNRVYSLTEGTKKILSKFMNVRQGQGVNWDQLTYEIAEQGFGVSHVVYVKLVGVDLFRILRKVYASKEKYADYNINLIKPISQFGGDNSNWLISICELDTRKVEALCKKIGMVPAQGAISMVRVK